MSEPWRCPACQVWLAPGIKYHVCADAIAGALVAQSLAQIDGQAQIAQEVLGSKVLRPKAATKRGSSYNKGYDQGFLDFWKVYPLRRDKRKAQIAWRKSLVRIGANGGANPYEAMAQILAGATRYRDDPNRDPGYTKYAEGWLNGDGWEDEPLPTRIRDPKAQAAADAKAKRDAEVAAADEFIRAERDADR